MKRIFLIPLLALSLGFGFVTSGSFATEMEYPSEFRASTATLLSSTTVMLMAAAPQFEEILGSKLRSVPSDLLASQCLAMKKGRADFWNVHVASAYRAVFGVEEYATKKWGPQKIRMTVIGGPVLLAIGVRANSGINKIEDLKGKKLGVYAGSEGFFSAYLAFGNLTLKDVQVVPATGYGGANTQLSENRIDAALCSVSDALSYEMDESPNGIRFLPLPNSDKEGWERLQNVYPALLPYTVPQNLGTKSAWGVEMSGFPYGNFVYEDQKDPIAYGIIKVFTEGYDDYKDTHEQLKLWTKEAALDCIKVPIPYHPGSIKYFKEVGLWTPAHEEWQKNQIRLENRRQEEWKKALAEAESKNMEIEVKNKEWQALWRGYLDRIE